MSSLISCQEKSNKLQAYCLGFGDATRAIQNEHGPNAHLDKGGHKPPDSGLDLGVLSAAKPVESVRKVMLHVLRIDHQYVGPL